MHILFQIMCIVKKICPNQFAKFMVKVYVVKLETIEEISAENSQLRTAFENSELLIGQFGRNQKPRGKMRILNDETLIAYRCSVIYYFHLSSFISNRPVKLAMTVASSSGSTGFETWL